MVLMCVAACFISFSSTKANFIQADGKQLFMGNCGACHHPTKDLTGPHFYGVKARWKNKKLLYDYVRNSTAVIKKDAYAKQVFEKWNKTIMTSFPKLTNLEIDAIFNYVDDAAKKKGLLN